MNARTLRSLSLAAIAALSSVTAFAPSALAEPSSQTQAALARVDDLATAMKHVNKIIEPSVVSIDVLKRGGGQPLGGDQEEMLKRFFPDTDGDGQPDLPPGFQFRFGPNDNDGALRMRGEGSGVILDVKGDTAYVLTNNHVAGGADQIVVTLSDGRTIEDAEVVGTDPRSDLAVLKIKSENLSGAKWADSDTLDKGDIVLAFGAPFGYVGSMTQGIVSALNRQAGILGQNGYENFIQTDCAINPGNSGGPLVNTHGEVVGINTAIASQTGAFNGIGFAIPSNQARFVYENLRDHGKVTRGFLGVSISDVTAFPQRAKAIGYKDRVGALVSEVRNDTPAEGKLQPNDVIVSLDGAPIATSHALRTKIATIRPGKEVKLGVVRDGKQETVSIKLAEFPDDQKQASAGGQRDRAGQSDGIGATLTDANANRLKSFGLPADAKGALVTAVKSGSPGALAGLEVGDLITRINTTDIATADDAVAAIKAARLADGVNLLIRNKDGTKSVFVQVDE